MAGNPIVIPITIPWFKAPSLQFWRIPQAVQRLWEYLKNIAHGGATRFKMKDWELAQVLGVSIDMAVRLMFRPSNRSPLQVAVR